jgi:GWxTD domain-containing protein
MKFRTAVILLIGIICLALVPGTPSLLGQAKKTPPKQPSLKEKDLPQRYQEWLKVVGYIIMPVEREVFMKLTNDKDRDIFVESFWKQRDPTPATPQNEYKDEHLRRFEYADKYYHRGTPRAGWMTDMGRIYIILGKPNSIERFDGTANIQPCQVWYYFGDAAKHLPTYFGLVFYQRNGSGEYKLYNPLSDGPTSLLIDVQGLDQTDSQAVYEKIRETAPTLAEMALNLIPGQIPYGYMPSPQTNIILANILESPRKDVSPNYATHFLDYRGYVSTEYMANFIENTAEVAIIRDAVLGIPFVHFSIVPKKISIDFYEPKDQYYCNFKLSVSLRKGEKMFYQYSKDFPFYFPPANAEGIQANGVAVEDLFPAIEGTYAMTVLLQNAVGKEFCVLEREVTIPGEAASPAFQGPVVGPKLQEYKAGVNAPFKFEDKKIQVDPNATLGARDDVAFAFALVGIGDDLWKDGRVNYKIVAMTNSAVKKEDFLKLSDKPRHKEINFAVSTPARDLPPDYYELQLALVDGAGKIVAEKKGAFVISPSEGVPHPITLSKTFPVANAYFYVYALAYQYDQVGLLDKAEEYYQKAYSANQDYKEGLADYARFLLRVKKFKEAMALGEGLKDSDKLRFEYWLIRGQAEAGLGDYGSAIQSLLEGNKAYNSDTRLLNTLGECYLKTGDKAKALDVLKSSLRLNPDQKDIQALVEKTEK